MITLFLLDGVAGAIASLYERDDPALGGFEREVYDAVSREEPWALVERFADPDRVSGTADERAAADYLTDRLDAPGIAYDRHDPELYLSRPGDAPFRPHRPAA